jgi:molecular chaperone GrpE
VTPPAEAPEPPQPPPASQTSTKAAAQPAQERERLQQQLKDAEQQRDQYLRAIAEFENTKKRLQREKEEFARFAAEHVVRELLPILDGLSQALVAVDKQSDQQAIIKGMHLINRQLLGLLQQEGVQRISAVGERFDPHKHEAVGQVELEDGAVGDDGTIVEEIQAGYTMHGRLVRPALVKVAKRKEST